MQFKRSDDGCPTLFDIKAMMPVDTLIVLAGIFGFEN
jgi:hypothetical protein